MRIGMARKPPAGPQSHIHNTRERNTANGLNVNRWPAMLGVMKWPSTVVKTRYKAGAMKACPRDENLISPTPNKNKCGPDVGDNVAEEREHAP
jgi:hypothetical protein